MINFVFCLLLVTGNPYSIECESLADVFELIGTIFGLINRVMGNAGQQSGSSLSSGKIVPGSDPDPFKSCLRDTRLNSTTAFFQGCGYCDLRARGDQKIANDHFCAQQCHKYKCDKYTDDAYSGCTLGGSDYCQCGSDQLFNYFVVQGAETRKLARNLSAGDCSSVQ